VHIFFFVVRVGLGRDSLVGARKIGDQVEGQLEHLPLFESSPVEDQGSLNLKAVILEPISE